MCDSLCLCIGYGVTNFIGPAPSGSVIANFEGAINATTLICNVTRGETQLDTFWNFANFRGVAGRQSLISLGSSQNLFVAEGLFLNELTVTSWTSEVDQVIVFCGTGGEPTQANVTLRIYRKFERRFVSDCNHSTVVLLVLNYFRTPQFAR